MHRPGPAYDLQSRLDQRGYICVEWWPDDLLAIKYASLKGVVVVEAGGSGGENLDDPLYEQSSTHLQVRNALRITGSPQQPNGEEHIGSRPDLRQPADVLLPNNTN
jgi:hypothetical protein